MNALPRAAALLVLDPDSEGDTERLLDAWRHSGRPVVHVRHRSDWPERSAPARQGPTRQAPLSALNPRAGEVVVQRQAESAFADTGLGPLLRDRRIVTLVVTGGLSNGSVAATLRTAEQLGFHTYLVADDGAGAACAGLAGPGTTLTVTEDILSAL